MRIVPKVILLVSLSVGIVMIGLYYVGTRQTEKVMHAEIHHLLECGLEFAAGDVLDRTEGVRRTSEIIARGPAISRSLLLQVSTGLNRNLNELISIYPFFKYVMIVEPDGDVFAINTNDSQGHKIAGEKILGLNFRQNPLFSEPSKKGTTVSAPGPDSYLELLEVKGGMNQWFITPVLQGETLTGWVVVSYAWEAEMSKLVGDITRQLTRVGHPVIETVLADDQGNIVVGSGPRRGRFVPSPSILWTEKPIWFGARKLRLIIANDMSEAMRPFNRLKSFFLIVGGVAALCLAVILYFVLRKTFLARLAVIQAGTQAFREGDLSYRLPSLGNDELGELSQTFNEMGQSLQTVMAELKVEKDRLALTFENTPVGLVACDTRGRFLTANPAFCQMMGYSSRELQGLSIAEVTHPDDVAESVTAVQDLVEGRTESLYLEKRYVRKDGSLCRGVVRSGLIRDGQGRPTMLVGAVEDVTERQQVQEALRASEKRYHRLFEDAPVMYVITRNERGVPSISDCNELFLRSVGRAREEVLGKPLAEFYSPESRTALLEGGGYASALAGTFFIGERQLVARDGGLVPTLLYTATEEDSSGRVIGTRAMFVDIAERKRVEQALTESEERFKAVFESHHAVMLIVDPENGQIVDGSPGACAFYGYSREELTKRKISEINTLSAEEIFERMQMAKSQQRRYFDFRHRLADGQVRDVEVCTGPIVIGGRTFLFSVIHDVTDRKQAEEALRQSEERNRLLVEASPIGIGILLDHRLAYANPTLLRTFGFESPQEMVGQPVHNLIDEADRERLLPSGQDGLAAEEAPPYYEATGVRKNGERFDLTLWPRRIDYLGEPATLFFLADTSESKGLRSQLVQAQKMEAIGTLAGGIAHDFNNLLTVILGYSELMISEKDKSDPDYEDLRKVIHAAHTAGDMVRQILAFSRKAETRPRPINLNKPLEQLQKMLSRLIPKTVEIKINLDPHVPVVYADAAQLEQVIINLAVNARDAMPRGGALTITTQAAFLDDSYCRSQVGAKKGWNALVAVTDNGVGIDRASMDRIFEPFYTTKKPGEGTGLGLAMVYGIVQAHGGHITCQSQVGKGTTFKIYLPAHEAEAESDVATSQEFAIFGTGTILLVDDEELVRALGKKILTKAGYTVITAADGQEAIEIYTSARDTISLVILDLIMPIMDGHQCLREILRIDPGAKVLIASGFTETGADQDATLAGAAGFVTKPFDLKVLLKAVRKALGAE